MVNPHITVPDETPFYETAVVGATSVFNFTFTFFNRTDLRVSVNDKELNQDEFEVAGTSGKLGGYPGGTVTLDVAVSNSTVKIWSDIPPVRINDFTEGAGFPARGVNTEIDKLTARQRDDRLRFQRIPTFSASSDGTLSGPQMGALWTNNAAAGALAIGLPPASAGLHAWFAVVAAHTFTLTAGAAGAADTITDGSSTGTSISSSTVGSILHLIGTDSGSWVVASKNGTWTLV